jgi:riboflavin kinase/FMN adenylyltransferase
MQNLYSIGDAKFHNAWATIGIFDGVHLGHQKILRSLVRQAHDAGDPALVLTFDPHPAIVLSGRTDFKMLTTLEERLELLGWLGVDGVIIQRFSQEFANQTASQFMNQLVKALGLRSLLIGYDTALGRGREGNGERLTEIGKELGYDVQTIPPLVDEHGIISSTRIRQSITSGQVPAAEKDLGRYYAMTGPVVHGDGRGHLIQVPTANIAFPHSKVLPANGIYAGWAWVDGQRYPAATNVGVRPTFIPNLPAPSIEAHLLDFDRDLYGKQVTMEFVEYLRPEHKYDSVEELLDQIKMDVARTRKVLA